MRISLLTLFLAFITSCYAQITFEPGYYIDNSGNKTNGLIKNIDWKSNPTSFSFKLNERATSETKSIDEVSEFCITNISKFIKASVKIDLSSDNIGELTKERNPTFETKTVFLKVLIEGKANLFCYENSNLKRFFFNIDNSTIEQLVYRRYHLSTTKITENNYYKQQLFLQLKSDNISVKQTEKLKYKKGSLSKLFMRYNNKNYVNYNEKSNIGKLRVLVRPGINFNKLKTSNTQSDNFDLELESKINMRLGLEIEYILPFFNNTWSFILEPTYIQYSSTVSEPKQHISGGVLNADVEYNSLELPIGIRYYYFINQKSKLFVNASFIFDIPSNSSITYTRKDHSAFKKLSIDRSYNTAYGLGYMFDDKYALEFRYHTQRNILTGYRFWDSNYSNTSVILSYRL